MPHTYTHLVTQVVFSTKDRMPLLDTELKARLFPYMGGIIRELEGKALIINGVSDHVHLLVVASPKISMSDFMRILKANSSRWVHETFPGKATFGWQTGYGAFSVSHSNLASVEKYIADQEEHHRHLSFKEEFITLLKKHGVQYDEQYIWD